MVPITIIHHGFTKTFAFIFIQGGRNDLEEEDEEDDEWRLHKYCARIYCARIYCARNTVLTVEVKKLFSIYILLIFPFCLLSQQKVSSLFSEDDNLQNLKETNYELQKKLQEKGQEITHLKLVISNLKGISPNQNIFL